MVLKPKVLPSGQIELDGQRYRLREVGSRFEIVHDGDAGNVLGSFEIEHGTVAKISSDTSLEAVQAIGEMYASPRGILPIQ
jgi:hypothetical protein